jgi:aryl-alcohol dehydrogenase-like predicted oxidoreductase
VLPTLRQLGIGLVAYSPLGRGFLTGSIRSVDDLPEDDWRRNNPRFQEDALAQNIAIADEVTEMADRLAITPAQPALAWVQARSEDIVAIPGTTSPTRLVQNAAAVDVDLSAQDVATLDAALPSGGVAGTRYSAKDMELLSN